MSDIEIIRYQQLKNMASGKTISVLISNGQRKSSGIGLSKEDALAQAKRNLLKRK